MSSVSSTTPAERPNPGLPPQNYLKDIRLHTTQLEGKPRDPYDAPVRLLTKRLIGTYKRINTVYYRKKSATKTAEADGIFNDGYDDTNYDYAIELGMSIGDNRYEVVKKLGKGSFGQVVRCRDTQTGQLVAVKIIKSRRPFFRQAQTEVRLLQHLNRFDFRDEWNLAHVLRTFVHKNHQCIVFELLSYNLYELLRNTSYRGVSLNLVRKFGRQILKTLTFMSLGCIDIIHCDLKPENVLLKNQKHSAIKVIDFGSSCRSSERVYTYIQSRFYRSPEVMLGLPYSTAIDVWSLGCILAEMHMGEPLFSGRDEYDQLQRIIAMVGMPPLHMLRKATKQRKFFVRNVGDVLPESEVARKRAAAAASKPQLRWVAGAGTSAAPATSGEPGIISTSGPTEEGDTYKQPALEAFEEVTDDEGEEEGQDTVTPSAEKAERSMEEEEEEEEEDDDDDKAKAGKGNDGDNDAAAGGDGDEDGKASDAKAKAGSGEGSARKNPRKRKRLRAVTYRLKDMGSKYHLSKSRRARTLRLALGVHTGGPHGRRRGEPGHEEAHYRMFYALLVGMLRYDPKRRTRPLDALRHPFFADTDHSYLDTVLSSLEVVVMHEQSQAMKYAARFRKNPKALTAFLAELDTKAASIRSSASAGALPAAEAAAPDAAAASARASAPVSPAPSDDAADSAASGAASTATGGGGSGTGGVGPGRAFRSALSRIDDFLPWSPTSLGNTTTRFHDLRIMARVERYRLLRAYMPEVARKWREATGVADPDEGRMDGEVPHFLPGGILHTASALPRSELSRHAGEDVSKLPSAPQLPLRYKPPEATEMDRNRERVLSRIAASALQEGAEATLSSHPVLAYDRGHDPYVRALALYQWLPVDDPDLTRCVKEAKAARILVHGAKGKRVPKGPILPTFLKQAKAASADASAAREEPSEGAAATAAAPEARGAGVTGSVPVGGAKE